MNLDIAPEPSDAERTAVEAALERLATEGRLPARGPWWEVGVAENLDDGPTT